MNQDRPFHTSPQTSGIPWRAITPALLAIALASSLLSVRARAATTDDAEKGKGVQIRVSFGPALSMTPLDGRLLVMLSTDPKEEPRFQINDSAKTQQIFGIDVSGLRGDQEVLIDSTASGYPVESLRLVPPGHYRAQALFHLYETFHRGDG